MLRISDVETSQKYVTKYQNWPKMFTKSRIHYALHWLWPNLVNQKIKLESFENFHSITSEPWET